KTVRALGAWRRLGELVYFLHAEVLLGRDLHRVAMGPCQRSRACRDRGADYVELLLCLVCAAGSRPARYSCSRAASTMRRPPFGPTRTPIRLATSYAMRRPTRMI